MDNRRYFGKTNISLSPVTLGTMRFCAERIGSQEQAVSLLDYLYDQGINTYHTSHEYDTHAFFCDSFKLFKKRRGNTHTTHIIKLSSPHFEEDDFSFTNLAKSIDAQLTELNIEQIDIVQWLFRQKNNIDEIRIPKLLKSIPAIEEAFDRLICTGKVRAISCFPYSIPFAKAVMQHNLVAGFVDYLNIIEQQWADLLHDDTMKTAGFIAIRPLFAGKVLQSNSQGNTMLSQFLGHEIGQNELTQWALSYPLLNPKVASIVLSISDYTQAEAAIRAANAALTSGDSKTFTETTNFINNDYLKVLNN